jgi:selT/selW/selH-like putative selenoprotein
MAITNERFAQGLTYEEYKAQMTRNRERLEENERTVELDSEDLAFFSGLPAPLNVVAIAEDWCGDVIANLPVLARLATESGTLNVRVFLRDQNLDLIDQYLKEGKFRSIPVFAFFDQGFQPIGHWIERPRRMTELMAEMRRTLFANHPALAGVAPGTPMGEMPEEARLALSQANANFRAENRGLADREVVRELRAIVAGQPLPAAESRPSLPAAPVFGDLKRRAAGRTAGQPVKVTITYCASCGYEPQTLELTSALMYEFLHDLASIELIPWQDGAFDVTIDGELVHSMYRDGGFPEPAAVVNAVRERLSR